MTSIHDNNVYAVNILCGDKKIILHTEFIEKEPFEYTDVIFSGVITHQFNNVWEGNILLDIEKQNPTEFYNYFESDLKQKREYGLRIPTESADLFSSGVESNKLKIFEIFSSYGLSGWVICKDMNFKERVYRKTEA